MISFHLKNRSNILITNNMLLAMHCTLPSSAKIKQYFNRRVDSNTIDLFMKKIGPYTCRYPKYVRSEMLLAFSPHAMSS